MIAETRQMPRTNVSLPHCRWPALAGLVCCIGVAGCWPDEDLPDSTGSVGGQVLISGPLRGARLQIDQLHRHTGEVQFHIGETTTDDAGRFALPTGTEHGIFRIAAQGGSYQDLATGATIQLDHNDQIVSLIQYGIVSRRVDALVSPIGQLVEARTMARLQALGDLTEAFEETRASLHHHFGNVDWGRVTLWPLDRPAISPTEPVRAAFVHAALSVLARDIAVDAQAGPQAVNVYRLMQLWTEDIRSGTFDGNDGNDRTAGSGLQLGFCPPVDPACLADASCAIGQCRRLCDLYSGTPRALLGGAMIKVINDNEPGGLNQTGLNLANTLPIVRALSDNADSNLFDASCIEALDRVAPRVRFDAPTPADATIVRGAVLVKAVAVDDVDPSPDTALVGFSDLDGDPSNSIALATIDTATLADGPRLVVARAVDLTGNVATAERMLRVDNTAPVITLDSAGFFDDGSTWWTASAAPLLTGTVADASPVTIKAVIAGGLDVSGTVSGTSWTIALPAGVLDAGGTAVEIVATDAPGNQARLSRRLRPDVDPPALTFQPSTVNDEAADMLSFATDHSPQHLHTGTPLDLSFPLACPVVTKFSSLLGSSAPEYTIELPTRNPLRYQLVSDDPGVGVSPGATEYRVGRRDPLGPATVWVRDWTSVGAGVPIATGATRFPVGIFAEDVPGLATMEGLYEVEFRATDRLARTTTATRCFDLRLRAPPLELEARSTTRPTKDHTYSLDSLSLAPGAPFDQIAARLLNHDATGASLIDQDVFNGTTSTIYLTVTVTPPRMVMVDYSFVLRNAPTNVVPATCGDTCIDAAGGPVYNSGLISQQAAGLRFPIRVFALVGGVPTTEIPCLAPCSPAGSVFTFAIPPRASGGMPAGAFRVMTMIGQVSALYPQDVNHPAIPPFFDDAITWTNRSGVTTTTRITGIVDRTVDPSRTGCVAYDIPTRSVCIQEGTFVPYRALTSAAFTFWDDMQTRYAVAATQNLTPEVVGNVFRRTFTTWSTSEGTLP